MAAQAGLCLAWSETPEDTFCRVVAHVVLVLLYFDYFSHFVCFVNLVSFYTKCYQSVLVMGTLWAQLLLQFSINCFETLQMLSAWNEDMHVVLI